MNRKIRTFQSIYHSSNLAHFPFFPLHNPKQIPDPVPHLSYPYHILLDESPPPPPPPPHLSSELIFPDVASYSFQNLFLFGALALTLGLGASQIIPSPKSFSIASSPSHYDTTFQRALGYLLSSDPEKAFDIFLNLAEKGHIPSQLYLFHCLWNGLGTPIALSSAERWLTSFSEPVPGTYPPHFSRQYYQLGHSLYLLHTSTSLSEAFNILSKLSKDGFSDPLLQYQLARCYIFGIGVPPDGKKGAKFLSDTISQNFPLGNYLSCSFLLERDGPDSEIIAHLRQLASIDLPGAYFLLGSVFLGRFGEEFADPATASICFQRASILNHRESIFLFALLNWAKLLPSSDRIVALRHLEKAANLDHTDAQYILATHLLGRPFNPNQYFELPDAEPLVHVVDIKRGIGYLNRAAKQNHPLALYSLGTLFYFGDLVEQDKELGLEYLEKSANLGYRVAQKACSRAFLDQGDIQKSIKYVHMAKENS